MFVDSQLHILHWMAGARGPLTDYLFLFLNLLDTFYYYIFLFPLIWAFLGRRIGFRFLFWLLLSGVINHILKGFFALPRPFIYDPSVALIQVKGYTFPSGAAQEATLFAFLVWDVFKNKKIIPWLVLYPLVLGLSRNFLGVHFPLDVIVGWAVGFVLFLFYKFLYKPYELKIADSSKKILILPLVITGASYLIFNSSAEVVAFFTLVGVAIAWCLVDFLQFSFTRFPFTFLGCCLTGGIIVSLYGLLFMLKWAIPVEASFKVPFLFVVLGFMLVYEVGVVNYLFARVFKKKVP